MASYGFFKGRSGYMNKLFIIKLATVLNNFQTYGSGLVILYNKFLVNKMSKMDVGKKK